MAERGDVDAVVVGASIAGCTAATLLARAGARVALVERRPDPAARARAGKRPSVNLRRQALDRALAVRARA